MAHERSKRMRRATRERPAAASGTDPAAPMPPAVPLTLKPMEADPIDALPEGRNWLFEPKHDGFRCLAFRSGDRIALRSKSQKPLERYFPELIRGLLDLPAGRFVIDGEIVIPGATFETLQLRLHPARSRVETLAASHPAKLIAFDLLANAHGDSLLDRPFAERREALEDFVRRAGRNPVLGLSKATRSRATAMGWLGRSGLDGVMAKRLDIPYRPGRRAMGKLKVWKTVDCVLGGIYLSDDRARVESLLLGLYDAAGRLHYVGRAQVREGAKEMLEVLKPLVAAKSFTGRKPGGRDRWSGRERQAVMLRPVAVAEVSADHVTDDFMRHGARLLRWRDDKAPEDCTIDQIR